MQHETSSAVEAWTALNQRHLERELKRLRLLLQRKVLWLRSVWEEDPLEGYQGVVVSETRADRALADRGEAEQAFYRENEQAGRIRRHREQLAQERSRQEQQMTEAGVTPALALLVQSFGLTAFERNVLLLCLAPESDPAFRKLYAYVQDDPARTYATPHLAMQLFAGSEADEGEREQMRPDAWDSFTAQAPLRRFRLVQLVDDGASEVVQAARPLRLDERVAAYLRGVNRLDPEASDVLRPVELAPTTPAHRALVQQLLPTLKSKLEQDARPAVNVVGASGAGKQAVAHALSSQLGLGLYRLDVERLPASARERRERLRLLEREAVLRQVAFYLDVTALDDADQAANANAEAVVDDLNVPLFVASRSRWDAERSLFAIHVPKPDAAAQEALWKQALSGARHRLNGQVADVVQQFDFGPEQMTKAVAAARRQGQLRGTECEVQPDDLWQACREQTRGPLDGLAHVIQPTYTWDDIVLPDDTFEQLQEIAVQVRRRARVYRDWGFGARTSRGLGISALFAGPSGTGKTMAAEILAHDLDLDLYRIDLASMVSKYIGETEKNLKKVFDAAERSGAILFFDEADALFGKRTDVSDSHDRYANIEIDYLLQRMEEYRGLAILATNRKGDMDRAFLRRLRFIVDFPRPDARLRRRIWQKAFPDEAPVGALDVAFLARMEITGANIHNIALNAAFLAADEDDAAIAMPHVMHAARREYDKIDRLITESEFGKYYDE